MDNRYLRFKKLFSASLLVLVSLGCTEGSNDREIRRLYKILSEPGITAGVSIARQSLSDAGIFPISEECFRATRIGDPNSPHGLPPYIDSSWPDILVVWEINKEQEVDAIGVGFETKNLGEGYKLEPISCNFSAVSGQGVSPFLE